MALEDNIRQNTFPNEREKVVINILYTHDYLVNELSKTLKNHNITRQQYNVLRILRGQHPGSANISTIKERMIEKMSDASMIVKQLEVKNLITKKTGDQSLIFINSKGLKSLDILDQVIVNFELENIQLNYEEAKNLNRLMDKLRGE